MVATMKWTMSIGVSAWYYDVEICYFNALMSKIVCGGIS